jgi:tellurite resistance protein TerC
VWVTAGIGTVWLWVGFNAFVLALLALDLFVLRRNAQVMRVREAALTSAFWIGVSLLFNGFLFFWAGRKAGLEFLTGYLIEKSLSIDNLFVFLLILDHFKVEPKDQHRVLFWGVIGAIGMRILFIVAGAALLARFEWMLYVFGGFLLVAGVRMLLGKEEKQATDEVHSLPLRILHRVAPSASPLVAVMVVIETSDVIFALDSIPAVFGVTKDPFIVYSSNILAVLGLRALYFVLVGVLSKLRYLKVGLAAVLSFVGAKMIASEWIEIGSGVSLLVIASILAITVVVSLIAGRTSAPKGAEA